MMKAQWTNERNMLHIESLSFHFYSVISEGFLVQISVLPWRVVYSYLKKKVYGEVWMGTLEGSWLGNLHQTIHCMCVLCTTLIMFVFLIVFIFFKITMPILFNEIVSVYMYYFYLPFCCYVLFFLWLIGGKCHLTLWCVCGNHSILTGWHHIFQSLETWIVLVSETRLLSNLSGNKLKHTKNAEVSFHMKSKEFASLFYREIIFVWHPSYSLLVWLTYKPLLQWAVCVMWCDVYPQTKRKHFHHLLYIWWAKTQYCVLCIEPKYVHPISWQIGRATSVMPPAVWHAGLREVLLWVIPNVVTVGAVHSFLEMSPVMVLASLLYRLGAVPCQSSHVWCRAWFVVGF